MRIVILSRTPIGARMSSPGIRYLNMRRVLKEALPEAEVVLAAPHEGTDEDGGLNIVRYTPARVLPLALSADVVIAMSFPLPLALLAPFRKKPVLVLDFFSQFHVEWIEVGRDLYRGRHRRLWTRASQLYANFQLLLADFILCANERQRDSYLGVLASLGLLTPATYDQDSTLRRLIDVAPHGVRPEPFPALIEPSAGSSFDFPQDERTDTSGPPSIKGRVPGIEVGDKLLLWLGGILYWYDPLTLLRALARVRETHPEVKLLFLGAIYPGSSGLGRGARLEEAIAEAKRLGLWQNGVYLQEEWLPHAKVVDYLRDADAAVTTYFTNAETRFAHRTRFLDYIWARLPIICTRGDVLADEVERSTWGVAVPERDEDGLVAAILRLVEDEAFAAECRANLAKASAEITWESAFGPLVGFLGQGGGVAPIARPRGERRVSIYGAALRYLALRARAWVAGKVAARASGP